MSRFVLLFLLSLSLNLQASDKIDAISYVPHPAIEQHYVKIIQNAYAKIELYPEFIAINDKRSLKLVNEGSLDGDVARMEDVLAAYPNLVKVPPALGQIDVQLVCQSDIPCNVSLFESKTHILGVVAKFEYYKNLLLEKPIQVIEVGNYERLKTMFQQKKLDAIIMVYDRNSAQNNHSFSNTYLIEKKYGYHLLHKKHSHLIPKLSKALAESINQHNFSIN